ncbi:MAG TPA: hypothetical protein VKV26_09390 [Dehalococcoidia bacterium]|nr:hypothetical protein [Dehalococcoidia bacterium]
MTTQPNPSHVIPVEDYGEATLRNLVAHLDVSNSFEHCVYRESELDAVWRLLDIALERGDGAVLPRERLLALRDAVHEAHDLAADEKPHEAAARLRALL